MSVQGEGSVGGGIDTDDVAVDNALDLTRRGAVDVDADKNILPWEHQGPADRCRHPRLISIVIIFSSFEGEGGCCNPVSPGLSTMNAALRSAYYCGTVEPGLMETYREPLKLFVVSPGASPPAPYHNTPQERSTPSSTHTRHTLSLLQMKASHYPCDIVSTPERKLHRRLRYASWGSGRGCTLFFLPVPVLSVLRAPCAIVPIVLNSEDGMNRSIY